MSITWLKRKIQIWKFASKLSLTKLICGVYFHMFSHFRPLAWRYNRPWGRNRSMSTTTWLKKKIKIWKFACKQILVREMSLWWLMLQINYCYPIVTWEKSLGLKPVSRDNFRREYLNLKISISSILTPNITSQCPLWALRLCCVCYEPVYNAVIT